MRICGASCKDSILIFAKLISEIYAVSKYLNELFIIECLSACTIGVVKKKTQHQPEKRLKSKNVKIASYLNDEIHFYFFDEKIIFEMEDEIFNTCRTFSMKNKNQEKNLIEMIKQNCRRIIKDKTGKKPFTNINIARL